MGASTFGGPTLALSLFDRASMTRLVHAKLWFIAVVSLLAVVLVIAVRDDVNAALNSIDQESIRLFVIEAGPAGPFAIVALMTIAIVASPIPSAPIAIAAGLVYGHIWGTILVVIGAELGAITAFAIARYFGREHIERLLGSRTQNRLLGSQNALMATVFVSRLLPFISFDVISYLAGLSRIAYWRFGVATLAGIVPASFVLAHLGATALEGQGNFGFWISLALGAAGLLAAVFWQSGTVTGPGDHSTERTSK